MLECGGLPEISPSLLFSESLHSCLKDLSSCFIFKQESPTHCLEGLSRYKMNEMDF